MQTLTLEAEVSPNGMIHLDVPVEFPPGKVEIVLVVSPVSTPIVQGVYSPTFSIQHPALAEEQNGHHHLPIRSQQEIAQEIIELLAPLKDVTWEEMKEGRKDDDSRW